jgi:hypothetical protein
MADYRTKPLLPAAMANKSIAPEKTNTGSRPVFVIQLAVMRS